MRTVTLAAAAVLWLGTLLSAQELSTEVYPSQEELLEALRRGQIEPEQYEILEELLLEGIDSSNVHLLDEIPNLAVFLRSFDSTRTALAREQAGPFLRPPEQDARPLARLFHALYQRVEENGPGRFRTRLEFLPSPHLDISIKVERTYTGRERLVGRRVSYRPDSGILREATLGNFSRRFGLGSVAGYRGRLLHYPDILDHESFLYPDYGGSNGAFVALDLRGWELLAQLSLHRDRDFRLTSGCLYAGATHSQAQLGLILGVNRLTSRHRAVSVYDLKPAGFFEYRYGQGRAAAEVSVQAGERSGIGSVVAEGRHRLRATLIRYAAWYYSRHYLDLSGGSKAGVLSHRDTLAAVSFGWRTRRTGTVGGMFKTEIPLADWWQWANAAVYHGLNRDTARLEILSAFVFGMNESLDLRLDYLYRKTRRGADRPALQRTRLESRFRSGNLDLRSYIGYETRDDRPDYLSLFARLRVPISRIGTVGLWWNLGRIDTRLRRIHYWYGYIRLSRQMFSPVEGAVKIAQRYSRESADAYLTTLVLEVRAEL